MHDYALLCILQALPRIRSGEEVRTLRVSQADLNAAEPSVRNDSTLHSTLYGAKHTTTAAAG
jgi:hypothetical protein